MILTYRRLLVDIFLNRSLSKSLAFCEFASVNFEPCIALFNYTLVGNNITQKGVYSYLHICLCHSSVGLLLQILQLNK